MDREIVDRDTYMTSFNIFPNFRRPINNKERRIQSIKFSPNNELMVAASNQRTLELYECNTAQQVNSFHLYKYGITVVDFMDANNTLLVGSMCGVKNDFDIRELDMTKNQFTGKYSGHTKPSVSLAVNIKNKYFVSGSHDKSVQVFDFRNPTAQIGRTNLSSIPLVALHPTSDIVAVGLDDSRIELHDLRCLSFGAFTTFKLNYDQTKWTSLKFSPNGDQLLVNSNSSKMRILNSFTGAIQQILGSRRNTLNITIDASYTPDSEYILSGSTDGLVYVFSNSKKSPSKGGTEIDRKLTELKSMQPEAITAVELNAKYSLMVTASSYVAFWAPTIEN